MFAVPLLFPMDPIGMFVTTAMLKFMPVMQLRPEHPSVLRPLGTKRPALFTPMLIIRMIEVDFLTPADFSYH